ncbi:MAG: hypothetical protein JWQ81_8062 [Amycolatopsis sp.]|uniref:DUF3558 family protein n=1 Tax=Amycolatopsis sp. TaxID=37632 RepID=UPI00262F2447|nr:DUF3558 family protein [Amycolatopsis sp.]MCU1687323.1 hypothetical protein [Amycolatopsis sp.]
MKSLRERRFVALAACSLLLLAACDPAQSGSSKAPSSGEQGGETSAVANSAPSIGNPLTADQFVAAPCASMSPAQLADLGVASGQVNNSDSGPACDWRAGEGTDIHVAYLETKRGLTNYYILNDSGSWKPGYFEPLDVQGYPAVYASDSDKRPAGVCLLSVGITNQLIFTVTVTAQTGDGSCATAKTVADDILTTIKS